MKNTAAIILAAGLGKRMNSDMPKVLHEINGEPMITSVIRGAINAKISDIVVVVGFLGDEVKKKVSEKYKAIFAYQQEQLGTGHAVECALPYLPDHTEDVVILCGDVPLLKSSTLSEFIKYHNDNKCDITIIGAKMKNPAGYGRLIMDKDENISSIVEESDANSTQKKINIVNSGIYCVKKELLNRYIKKIDSDNAQKEYYLTDIIKIAYNADKHIKIFVKKESAEFIGVNSAKDLNYVQSFFSTKK